MLVKTSGIVLRTIKYGDSGLIVHIFCETLGLQSFMVKGARSSRSKSPKGPLLQVGNQLDLVVYFRNERALQSLSEIRLSHVYQNLPQHAVKSSILLYTAELLQKILKQPDANTDLFHFISNMLKWLDRQEDGYGNLPLYIPLKVAECLGFGIQGRWCKETSYLDLQEGHYVSRMAGHVHALDVEESALCHALIQSTDLDALKSIKCSREVRGKLMFSILEYMKWHITDFQDLKSPRILHEVLH